MGNFNPEGGRRRERSHRKQKPPVTIASLHLHLAYAVLSLVLSLDSWTPGRVQASADRSCASRRRQLAHVRARVAVTLPSSAHKGVRKHTSLSLLPRGGCGRKAWCCTPAARQLPRLSRSRGARVVARLPLLRDHKALLRARQQGVGGWREASRHPRRFRFGCFGSVYALAHEPSPRPPRCAGCDLTCSPPLLACAGRLCVMRAFTLALAAVLGLSARAHGAAWSSSSTEEALQKPLPEKPIAWSAASLLVANENVTQYSYTHVTGVKYEGWALQARLESGQRLSTRRR